MKLSIFSAALLASLVHCQTVNVFTIVETLYVISTQGQTGPATTHKLSSSIISSYTILSTSSILKSTSKSSTSTSVSSATFTSSSKSLTSSKAASASSSMTFSKASGPSSSSFSTKTSSSTAQSTSSTRSSSLSASKSTSTASSSTVSSSSLVSSSSSGSSLPAATDYPSTGSYYHNKHRFNHSAPIMTWNPTQAAIAAQIASSCVFTHNMPVAGGGYGQNLAAYGSSGAVPGFPPSLMLAKSITNQWYYGKVNNFLPSYYDQATPDMTTFGSYGHFTQVVWSGSLTVGCANQFVLRGRFSRGLTVGLRFVTMLLLGIIFGSFGTNGFPALEQTAIGPV